MDSIFYFSAAVLKYLPAAVYEPCDCNAGGLLPRPWYWYPIFLPLSWPSVTIIIGDICWKNQDKSLHDEHLHIISQLKTSVCCPVLGIQSCLHHGHHWRCGSRKRNLFTRSILICHHQRSDSALVLACDECVVQYFVGTTGALVVVTV